MNILENMMMQRLMASLSTKPLTPEEVMGNQHALAAVPNIDPARCRGLVILAALDETNEAGETGVQLVTSMAGSEQTIDALVNTAELILRLQHLKRCHPEDVAKDPLLSELLKGDSQIDAVDVHEHFGGCGDPRH